MDKRKNSFSSDESDDEVQEIEVRKVNKQIQRVSVSAEAYGLFNKRENFQPRVIAKPQETVENIKKRLQGVFMFSALEENERNIVVNAMEEVRFKAGDQVINQGEEGNLLYVVESGELDCFKKYFDKPEPTYLKTYQPGEYFGELALLYNAPRAASIKAKTDVVLYGLDRETFNHIVKDASMKRRALYEDFFKTFELLKTIVDPYEKTKLADAVEVRDFQKNEVIVQQGSNNTNIYIVYQGEVVAKQNDQQLFKYESGHYFGEIPVLTQKPQPFTFVSNAEKTSILIVGERDYRNTLVIVEDKLKKCLEKYSAYY
ncbi:hypothetical protein ABPG72_011771 [Tetrahymena utriculariae]